MPCLNIHAGKIARHKACVKHVFGLCLNGGKLVICAARLMVKNTKTAHIGRLRQPHPFLPGRMAPANPPSNFIIISAVINRQIGMLHKGNQVSIWRTGLMLGIGGINKMPIIGRDFQRVSAARMRYQQGADLKSGTIDHARRIMAVKCHLGLKA